MMDEVNKLVILAIQARDQYSKRRYRLESFFRERTGGATMATVHRG